MAMLCVRGYDSGVDHGGSHFMVGGGGIVGGWLQHSGSGTAVVIAVVVAILVAMVTVIEVGGGRSW